jgi:hypothetical protein
MPSEYDFKRFKALASFANIPSEVGKANRMKQKYVS